ncbi:hypothetical protein FJ417_24670 [Mesorhizobium sp. B3-1-7]|uniref:hypothetical protein n=1 Tax=Mesorhizobium sp. B3-1-7 TaxID=2589894 RepID=UPI0011297913|nr:hypothetical protein [Mesorhizobium sp. B3-1-7]TPI54747.1 hypothetical protein FJ417_24670 [Mesorhizobium sp. B3-1-7]
MKRNESAGDRKLRLHGLDTQACVAAMKGLGDHFGTQIATRAISEGWDTDQIDDAVEAVLQSIRAYLSGAADVRDIEITLFHVHLALVRAGKHTTILLLDDGGNA